MGSGPLFAGRRESGAPGVAVARPARCATAALLRSGGPSAVTIDAVTRAANVARATLYRHFPSGNDLLAAAFNSLIPASPMPPGEGSRRGRLIALGLAQAEFVAEAPTVLTAMSLALGRHLGGLPEPRHTHPADSAATPPCASASPSNTRRRSTRYSIAQRPRN